MPQMIDCPECGATLRIKDELLGKHVRCPGCSVVISTEKPTSAKKKPIAQVEEDEDDVEEDLPTKPVKKRRKDEEEGPPKWLIQAIIGGTVLILIIVLGGLAFLVFGTNLLTPKPKPVPTQAPVKDPTPTTTPATGSPPTLSPPTAEPPKDKWVRKLIPGTKVSVEVPESSGGQVGELGAALAELGGGGGVSGTLSTMGIPKIFSAMIAPDFTGGLEGKIDFIGSVEEEAKKDEKIQILSRTPVQGRKAIVVLRKMMGTQLQMYLVEGQNTLLLTISGIGVSENMPSVKRFFESIRFEK